MPSASALFAVALFLAGSLFVANLIAWGLQFLRDHRIAQHARHLARATAGSTPITVITGTRPGQHPRSALPELPRAARRRPA